MFHKTPLAIRCLTYIADQSMLVRKPVYYVHRDHISLIYHINDRCQVVSEVGKKYFSLFS